jgi:hypothetical protein
MKGGELSRVFADVRPDTRVAFMSGYLDDEGLRGQLDSEGGRVMTKPLTPLMLAQNVRAWLDEE